MIKNSGNLQRLRYAIAGVAAAFRRERSTRDEVVALAAGSAVLAFAGPSAIWWALWLVTGLAALACELLNAAVEAVCDRLHPERHPDIGAAKDMASGAVLLLNLALAAVFAFALADGLV